MRFYTVIRPDFFPLSTPSNIALRRSSEPGSGTFPPPLLQCARSYLSHTYAHGTTGAGVASERGDRREERGERAKANPKLKLKLGGIILVCLSSQRRCQHMSSNSNISCLRLLLGDNETSSKKEGSNPNTEITETLDHSTPRNSC